MAITDIAAAELLTVIWSVNRAIFCLAVQEITITRLLQNVKKKSFHSNFIFQGRIVCSGIYILEEKCYFCFLRPWFLFIAMHSWLHEHKQMWTTYREMLHYERNKFNMHWGNLILSLSEWKDNHFASVPLVLKSLKYFFGLFITFLSLSPHS
jgi:hypothetical protein